MITFLTIILVLELISILYQSYRVHSLTNNNQIPPIILESLNKITFSTKKQNIIWWTMLGIFSAFKIAIIIMLIIVIQ